MGLLPTKPDVSLRNHFRSLAKDFELGALQSAFLITFLAHQAWLMVDAVLRTLGRLVTRKRMLEWVTAAQARSASTFDHRSLVTQIVASAVFTVAVGVLLAFVRPHIWPVSTPPARAVDDLALSSRGWRACRRARTTCSPSARRTGAACA